MRVNEQQTMAGSVIQYVSQLKVEKRVGICEHCKEEYDVETGYGNRECHVKLTGMRKWGELTSARHGKYVMIPDKIPARELRASVSIDTYDIIKAMYRYIELARSVSILGEKERQMPVAASGLVGHFLRHGDDDTQVVAEIEVAGAARRISVLSGTDLNILDKLPYLRRDKSAGKIPLYKFKTLDELAKQACARADAWASSEADSVTVRMRERMLVWEGRNSTFATRQVVDGIIDMAQKFMCGIKDLAHAATKLAYVAAYGSDAGALLALADGVASDKILLASNNMLSEDITDEYAAMSEYYTKLEWARHMLESVLMGVERYEHTIRNGPINWIKNKEVRIARGYVTGLDIFEQIDVSILPALTANTLGLFVSNIFSLNRAALADAAARNIGISLDGKLMRTDTGSVSGVFDIPARVPARIAAEFVHAAIWRFGGSDIPAKKDQLAGSAKALAVALTTKLNTAWRLGEHNLYDIAMHRDTWFWHSFVAKARELGIAPPSEFMLPDRAPLAPPPALPPGTSGVAVPVASEPVKLITGEIIYPLVAGIPRLPGDIFGKIYAPQDRSLDGYATALVAQGVPLDNVLAVEARIRDKTRTPAGIALISETSPEYEEALNALAQVKQPRKGNPVQHLPIEILPPKFGSAIVTVDHDRLAAEFGLRYDVSS